MSDQELRLAVLTAGYIAAGQSEEMALKSARATAERMAEGDAVRPDGLPEPEECKGGDCTHGYCVEPSTAAKCVRCGKKGSVDGNCDTSGNPSCGDCYDEYSDTIGGRDTYATFIAWHVANPIATAVEPRAEAVDVLPGEQERDLGPMANYWRKRCREVEAAMVLDGDRIAALESAAKESAPLVEIGRAAVEWAKAKGGSIEWRNGCAGVLGMADAYMLSAHSKPTPPGEAAKESGNG